MPGPKKSDIVDYIKKIIIYIDMCIFEKKCNIVLISKKKVFFYLYFIIILISNHQTQI